MFSTPLIDSSSGVATVSAMTFGFAPGYVARTTIEGGTTSGYSDTGSCVIAMAPARKTMIDSTPAKIGRSMKKREMFTGLPLADHARSLLGCTRFHRHGLRRDG